MTAHLSWSKKQYFGESKVLWLTGVVVLGAVGEVLLDFSDIPRGIKSVIKLGLGTYRIEAKQAPYTGNPHIQLSLLETTNGQTHILQVNQVFNSLGPPAQTFFDMRFMNPVTAAPEDPAFASFNFMYLLPTSTSGRTPLTGGGGG